MKLDYREYYYGGDYVEKSVEIPDGSRIFDLKIASTMYRVKDIAEEVYSRKYLILCDTIEGYTDSELSNEFDNYYIFGNKMIIVTNNNYIAESEDLENFPNEIFKDYVIKFLTKQLNFKYMPIEERFKIINEYPYYCIDKITGIYYEGFITDRIYLISSYTLDREVSIEENYKLPFSKIYSYGYYPKFILDKDILTFNNTLTNIYNKIINK